MALNNDKKNSSNLWATACGSCLYEIDINESAHKAASLIIHDVVIVLLWFAFGFVATRQNVVKSFYYHLINQLSAGFLTL